MKRRTSLGWAIAAVASAALCDTACTSEVGAPAPPAPAKPPAVEGWQKHHTIPVSVRGRPGSPPRTVAVSPFRATTGSVSVSPTPSLLDQAAAASELECEDGPLTLSALERDVLRLACRSSLTESDYESLWYGESPGSPYVIPAPYPWFVDREYVWSPADDCDTQLSRMEFLLCSAELMMSWSESSSPVKREVSECGEGGCWATEITLPLLPSESRFVPRDIATYYLAQIAKIDANRLATGELCGKLVAQSPAHPTTTGRAFGQDSLDPPPPDDSWLYHPDESIAIVGRSSGPTDLLASLATARTKARLHILRSGSRLLREAGRATIDSDRGHAEREMSRAGDPKAGAERYWGVTTGADPSGLDENGRPGAVDPYNSMAHLYSYFFGRWERNGETNSCPDGNGAPYDQVLAARMPNVAKRITAYPPRTPGGQRAVALLAEANVVVPDPTDGAPMREVLTEILSASRATGAATVAASLEGITEAEFKQATDYVWRHAFLAGASADAFEWVALATSGDGYYRLKAGRPSSDGFASGGSQLGSVQIASLRGHPRSTPAVDNTLDEVAQNYSTLAVSFMRRINDLGRWADPAAGRLADAAATEVKAWTGGSFAEVDAYRTGGVRKLDIRIFGPQASSGATTAIVKGTALDAQCAAGLREACAAPEDIDIFAATADTTTTGDTGADYGAPGAVRTLQFEDAGSELDPSYRGSPDPEHDQMFLVELGTLGAPGKVLSGLSFSESVGIHNATIVPLTTLVEELGSDTLAVPNLTQCAAAGDCTIQKAKDYCLSDSDGHPYPRDLFVPLENELTSNGDDFENGWKQYLTRAKESAERADTIGKESLRFGIDLAQRRELAQARLAEICGTEGLPGSATFAAHVLDLGDADPALKRCLDYAQYDKVILGTCPPANTNCACKPPGGTPGACWTGLDLVQLPPPIDESADRCNAVSHSIEALNDALTAAGSTGSASIPAGVHEMFSSPRNYRASAAERIEGLRFRDEGLVNDAMGQPIPYHWTVTYQGARIMSSRPPAGGEALWPGCLGAMPDGCPASADADIWNRIFRTTTPTLPGTIRWRVMGAINTLARIGGASPAGLFTLYIPEVTDPNFSGASVVNMYPITEGGDSLDANTLTARRLTETTIPTEWLPGSTLPHPNWIAQVRQNPGAFRLLRASTGACYGGEKFFPMEFSQGLDLAAEPPGTLHGGGDPSLQPPFIKHRAGVGGCGAGGALLASGQTVSFADYYKTWTASGPAYEGRGPGTAWRTLPRFGSGPWDTHYEDFTGPFPNFGDFSGTAYTLVHLANGDCVGDMASLSDGNLNHLDGSGQEIGVFYSRRFLRPSVTHPDARVNAFSNGEALDSNREFARRMAAAVGLNCRLFPMSGPAAPEVTPPPTVTSAEDIPKFRSWLLGEAARIEVAAGSLSLEGVPAAVVDEVKARRLSQAGTKVGEVGQANIRIAKALISIHAAFGEIAKAFRSVAADVDVAALTFAKIDAQKQIALSQIALAEINLQRRRAAAASNVIGLYSAGTIVSLNFGGVAASLKNYADEIAYGSAEQDEYNKQAIGQENAFRAEVGLAAASLSTSASQQFTLVQQALFRLQSDAADVASGVSSVRRLQASALQQVAIAVGEPYYIDANGDRVDVPMNAVLDRQYDVSRIRYAEASAQAKYHAYVARHAIEQRLLVKLGDIDHGVGPLEAPRSWVDDICTMRGIRFDDYALGLLPNDGLSGASDGIGGPDDPASIGDDDYKYRSTRSLAREHIGDYVEKLHTFVDFYNVSSPFHEGDDQTVISLRHDAIPPAQSCSADARNLLLFSSDLTASAHPPEGEPEVAAPPGWHRSGCDNGSCLYVERAETLDDAVVPGLPQGSSSWLRAVPVDVVQGPPGIFPANAAWQEVELQPGPHVLSFWAQARNGDGTTASAPATRIGASVTNEEGYSALPITLRRAADPDSPGGLSFGDRQQLNFEVGTPGRYRVSLLPVRDDGGAPSALIAGAQLERATGPAGLPSSFQETSSEGVVFSAFCADPTLANFQSVFSKECQGEVCSYVLKQPMVLDASRAGTPGVVERRLAGGNFNYRHRGLALNLVGTGVLDCSREGPECYGNSTVEYTLEHGAFGLNLPGWDSVEHRFNFGGGAINHGRLLAAERSLTIPLGVTDQGLVAQPGIEKLELVGRPLDGVYRLRIWDRPALVWSRVEDVQLVLRYRFWSRTQTSNGGK